MFTWNARTGYLDTIAERSGLEIVGYVLSPVVWLWDRCAGWWDSYLALVDVAAENARLRAELEQSRASALLASEDRAELQRLRDLLGLEALRERPAFAARVIAKRFGPQAVLKTFTVNKGFLNGATAGTPVVTRTGVVGRVLRASPHTATVLMLTDPGFRLAVISNESRTPGIITGSAERRLEVAYVAQNARIAPGEMLITSGADGSFPKGIPVGVVTQVMPGNEILFLQVHARPLVDMDRLEEVLLLKEKSDAPPLLPPESTPG
ncbi:MAG: rod shape-determining protein MreC [Desulfovibrio sp.]|nr:rod shape-determining protein MreC [Desulfovibrio sp.]